MARQKIVAGNWKMNKNLDEGIALAEALAKGNLPAEVEVIMCTPYIHLNSVANITKDITNLNLGAQNCHQEESGAYTGEISAGMLASIEGLTYVVLGHSERRAYFGEDNALLAKKTDAALAAGLRPIFCCGEPLEVREADKHVALVSEQLTEGLFHLPAEDFSKIVIAYEPVWAIGTGVTASPQQAQDMHKEIRNLIAGKYGAEVADNTSILYGGSVKPNNAEELFSQPDVDGGLVGGASLKADDFLAIAGSY
ncbi:MAG TPA: triose-phosphate isomerase [Saprospiraceae bacterium]|nr:triose-phosphate isomerase [Saprospiraceae bacterium]